MDFDMPSNGKDGQMEERPDMGLVAEAQDFGPRSIVGHVDVDTLSPRAIRDMLLEAERGDLASQAELFEKMEEKDGELDAHLRTRKSGVSSLGHEIEPADESRAAAEAAAFCREVLGGLRDMRQAVFDLMDAVPKGFSVLEIEWRTEARRWTPVRFHWRPQRWFRLADDGETLLLREAAGGAEMNPLNFIVHRVKARSGFCARTGLLRSCVRAFVVRHLSWKDWLAFAEVYGMPPRIGRLREGVPWDSAEARQLWAAVRALGMDAAAVVREGNTIEVMDTRSAGEGEIFERILDRASREMTLAILGQTLTSGGEKGGSYALGKVHNQVRWDLVQSDALALDDTLTRQLIEPLVRLNLGPDAPPPRWRFILEEPEDLAALAGTVKTLAEAGLPSPMRWVYDRFNIPRPAAGEPVLGGSAGRQPSTVNQ
jgi:phage gp29-like protein